jgi:hypothetical protein
MAKTSCVKRDQTFAIRRAQQEALLSAAESAVNFDTSSLSEYARSIFITTLPEPFDGQSEADYDEFVLTAANAFQRAFEREHGKIPHLKTRREADLEQCETLESLLKAERRFASHWWTVLNEMRWQGDLPEWVKAMEGRVGSHVEMDALFEAQNRTDVAIGRRDVAYLVMDAKRNVLADGVDSFLDAAAMAGRLREAHPTAIVVRSLKTNLVASLDGNERLKKKSAPPASIHSRRSSGKRAIAGHI